ncbi:hypothetical protein KY284_032870 [Solanum tuberosum]|nr:hypothetical protein KY284_032870 [Solanum tuberosum]
MASYQFESFHVRFIGKKYSTWEFQFQLFVTGKELYYGGHTDGSDPTPIDPTKFGRWKVKYAQVMTWILGSIDPIIVLNLRPYKIAKAMELLREEHGLFTQNAFHQGNVVIVAFTVKGKEKGKDMARNQCYNCKKYGHIASNCGKKANDFQVGINGSTTDSSSSVGQGHTPETVQQMILSAFSALGLQGSDVGDDNRQGA